MDSNIRITGEAGQGVQTVGSLLTAAFAAMGLHVYSTQSYMSRIRGGVNSCDIRISDTELFSPREKADLLVALNAESLGVYRGTLASGGAILFDGATADGVISLDMAHAAKEAGGTKLMSNTVAAGAALTLLGYDVEALSGLLEKQFRKKGEDIVKANIACAKKGAEAVAGRKGVVKAPAANGRPFGVVTSGGNAVGLSAAVSGVKVASSYPMTPSTAVFNFLAGAGDKYGIVVEQAEDEIAAVNLICGATYAGVPAMTTTSGGGFALMVEGLALAGMLELPVFILLSQRPGPATGLPTRTAQEDLLFAVNAGHGVFTRAIFAPGGIAQAYDLTRRALETAHKFQTPAIIMTDQFLIDLEKNIPALSDKYDPIDRRILENPPADYERYEITADGISPRALPGGGVFVVVDSDEHTTDGHLTEDLEVRIRMQDKRLRKSNGILAESLAPEVYPDPADSDEALVCWGSTYGPCREAVDILKARGRKVCMVHFAQVWPIDPAKAAPVLKGRKVTAVEGNCNAQLALLLKQAGVLDDYKTILRYDGLPFTAEYIVREAER